MKIECYCGTKIVDNTDALPYKAHILSDQDLFAVMDAIDDAIEKSGPTPEEKEVACMRVRQLLGEMQRFAYQCWNCGRIYVDDQQRKLNAYAPAT